jgi:hypothetical protein
LPLYGIENNFSEVIDIKRIRTKFGTKNKIINIKLKKDFNQENDKKN